MSAATRKQAVPCGNGVDIATLVQRDIEARARIGEKKYGERLQPKNGRSALVDAYQEVLDLAMYLKQQLIEDGHIDEPDTAHQVQNPFSLDK